MRWLLLAFVLAVSGATCLLWSRRARRTSGVPRGRIIYEDTGAWQHCERPLFSQQYHLTGKPDYLVEKGTQIVPVEVKPGRDAGEPYHGDILQVAAYCLLVEQQYGRRPPFGYLKYSQTLFRVDYTTQLRQELLSRLATMRRDLESRDVAPSHTEPHRCLACGHRHVCDQRLA
jgi:CRISPR-associated exonuclease Cas4